MEDIDIAQDIHGKQMASIKARRIRGKQERISQNKTQIPEKLIQKKKKHDTGHRYHEGKWLSFFCLQYRWIFFTGVHIFVQNRMIVKYMNARKQNFQINNNSSFTITQIRADNEFNVTISQVETTEDKIFNNNNFEIALLNSMYKKLKGILYS